MISPRHYILLSTLLIVAALAVSAARAQDDEEEKLVVIKAGRVITVSGEELVQAEIVLADGKVRLVGKSLDYPKSAKVIDARREVVMPGMIHPRTRWQLSSYSRSGIHGDRSAAKEVFLDQVDFEPLLKAGFTAVCFYPSGTGMTGPGAVYRTAGEKKSRDLGTAYLRITMSSPARDKKTLRDAVAKARKEIEKVEKARKEWEEKQKKAKEEAAKKAKKTPKEGEKPKEEPKSKPDAGKDSPRKAKVTVTKFGEHRQFENQSWPDQDKGRKLPIHCSLSRFGGCHLFLTRSRALTLLRASRTTLSAARRLTWPRSRGRSKPARISAPTST